MQTINNFPTNLCTHFFVDVICIHLGLEMITSLHSMTHTHTHRASRAKLQRLEKETREMEKSMEALRHAQAKCSELEKTNKKLQEHALGGRKEIARLKEQLQVFKTKVGLCLRKKSLKSSWDLSPDLSNSSCMCTCT